MGSRSRLLLNQSTIRGYRSLQTRDPRQQATGSAGGDRTRPRLRRHASRPPFAWPGRAMTLAGQTRARAALPGLRAGCDEQRAPHRLAALPPQHSLLLRRHREAGGSEP